MRFMLENWPDGRTLDGVVRRVGDIYEIRGALLSPDQFEAAEPHMLSYALAVQVCKRGHLSHANLVAGDEFWTIPAE